MLTSLPNLPVLKRESPKILKAMQKAYQDPWWPESDEDEFYWFSREYGRVLRHHFWNMDYRLQRIHCLYVSAHERASKDLEDAPPEQFGYSFSDQSCLVTHWEFEGFLNAAGAALDVIARLVGPAYTENTPPSFSKLCKKTHLTGYADDLRDAEERWVKKMKSYRDCFVHYTPSDTLLKFSTTFRGDKSYLIFQIPVNPDSRDITMFRWSINKDLLRTAIDFRKKIHSLDKKIGIRMTNDHSNSLFPLRCGHLLRIGRRG
jgi:hypothetical protein